MVFVTQACVMTVKFVQEVPGNKVRPRLRNHKSNWTKLVAELGWRPTPLVRGVHEDRQVDGVAVGIDQIHDALHAPKCGMRR